MKKHKKNKGLTLIEIIISLAILSILIIPVSNLIVYSVKTNKASEDKQIALTTAQQIIEEIKAMDDFSEEASGITLTKVPGKNDEFTGTKTLSGDFSAAITIKPKSDLTVDNGYDSSVSYVSYDADFLIEGTDSNIKVVKQNGANVNYSIDLNNLVLVNDAVSINIENNNGAVTASFPKASGSNGKLRIKFGPNTNINSEFKVKISNNISEAFSVYFEADEEAKVRYSIDNLQGKIRKYTNVLKPEEEVNTSRAYEIEVIMMKKNQIIYSAKAYKTMY